MFDIAESPPAVCFVGRSKAGKTTIIERLIPQLTALGLAVGTIKHDLHGFDIDTPGKDSWRHKQAGARRTLISSPTQFALIQDTDHDWGLDRLLGYFAGLDLVLVEGFMRESRPKVAVYRPEIQAETLGKGDIHLIAVVTTASVDWGVPRFGFEDISQLAGFLKSCLFP